MNKRTGAFMRRVLILGSFLAMAGCAQLNPFAGPPVPMTPDTPIFFQPLSTALDQPALATVAQLAQAAGEQPDARVIVTGAADTVGTTQANTALSKARADAVARQLAADGVAVSRLHTHWVGETGSPGNTAQASRRVLVHIGG
jgi:outer membrane protein OmpA-like peptidoglycan-associated protein